MSTNLRYKLPTLEEYLAELKRKKQPMGNVPTPMSFTLPNVSSILNPPLTTPPFVDPTIGETPDLSVPNELPSVFGGAMPKAGTGEESKGGGKREMLANIFNAIASGAAIFGSKNPGETLMEQLMQRRREAMQKQQIEAEQQAQQSQIEFQKAMKREEQSFRKSEQKTEIAAGLEKQARQQKHELLLTDQEFLNKKDLQETHAKTEKELAMLTSKLGLDSQLALLQARDAGDLKQMKIQTIMKAMLTANKYHQAAPVEYVWKLVDKIEKGQAFTEEDFKHVNTAVRLLSRGEGSGGGGGAVGTFAAKQGIKDASALATDRRKYIGSLIQHYTEPQYDDNGNVIRDATGKVQFGPPGTDPTRMGEIIQRQVDMYDELNMPEEQRAALQYSRTPEGMTDAALRAGTNPLQVLEKINSSKWSEEEKRRARAKLKQYAPMIQTEKKQSGYGFFPTR